MKTASKKQKQFTEFITEVAEVMKRHNVEDMVCIFGMNEELRNTYIPLGSKGEVSLYCSISDAFNAWLKQGVKTTNKMNRQDFLREVNHIIDSGHNDIRLGELFDRMKL